MDRFKIDFEPKRLKDQAPTVRLVLDIACLLIAEIAQDDEAWGRERAEQVMALALSAFPHGDFSLKGHVGVAETNAAIEELLSKK